MLHTWDGRRSLAIRIQRGSSRFGIMKETAFVSHFDCSRHDTGWNYPDHQGRLPGLMRAVYADMLTLFEPLLEVEGRHATEEELRLLHSPGSLDRLRGWVEDAAAREETIEPETGVRVSGASWDAATAAVGSALTGAATVLAGDAGNAFCAVRPPGRYVTADGPARFGLLNTVASLALHLLREHHLAPVLVVEWGGPPDSPTRALLTGHAAHVVGVHREAEGDGSGWSPLVSPSSGRISLPAGAGGAAFLKALDDVLATVEHVQPAFVLLSSGFDGLRGDPLGDLDLTPHDYYRATLRVREIADSTCGGRLVSILEGGYDARMLGAATVQHLRALAGLDPVA